MLNPRIALLMSVPPLLWAGNAVVGRLMVGSMPPLTLNALRWWLAMALLLPLGWRLLRDPAPLLARWRPLALLGLLGVGSYNALQYMAVTTSSPLNVTLIAASAPVFMMAVGAWLYGEPPGRRQVFGAVLSLAGVLLVISRGEPESLLAIRFVAGDLLMLVATALWALYSWQLARPPASMQPPQRPGWDWAEFLLAQVIFGTLWATLFAAGEQALQPPPIAWNGWVIAALVYVAVGPSLIAYRCWGLGVTHAGPAMAAFFANLTPLFTAVLSTALLGEVPRWFHAAAFALIVAGILVSSRKA